MAYNQVNISSGHSINCQGAADIINEVTEARKVVDRVYEIIKASGKACYKYHDTSSSSSQNLVNIVNWHNGFKDGVDVSIHFNAYTHTNKAMGTEVCYYSNSYLATVVSKEIANAGGFIDRGAKQRTGLYFLKNTNKPAILIEVCFVDSITDVVLYEANFEKICQAIAKSLIGTITISENKTEELNRSMYVFSKNWYLCKYPDVANSVYKDDPYQHYVKYGKNEGRLPIPPIPKEYKESDYLELNPDVAAAVEKGTYSSGLHHYLIYGWNPNEQRRVSK